MGYSDVTVPETNHIRRLMRELRDRNYTVSDDPSGDYMPPTFNPRYSMGYKVENAVLVFFVVITKTCQFGSAHMQVYAVPNKRNIPPGLVLKATFDKVMEVTADKLEEAMQKSLTLFAAEKAAGFQADMSNTESDTEYEIPPPEFCNIM